MTFKPILCLDFDGVIHSYESGWKGADVIPDPPVDGALAFIRDALETFDVHVYSTRTHQDDGRLAMQAWCVKWAKKLYPEDHNWIYKVNWPLSKPPAKVTIDDRAITFTGYFPELAELVDFEPWNKKGK